MGSKRIVSTAAVRALIFLAGGPLLFACSALDDTQRKEEVAFASPIEEEPEPKKQCFEKNVICTPAGFQSLASAPEEEFYLGADIDFEELNFQMIQEPFSGSLNGQGYRIKNLKLGQTVDGLQSQALFKKLEKSAVLRNLEFESPQMEFIVYVAGAGHGGGILAVENEGLIENVHITNGEIGGGRRVGGLVGQNSGVIRDSSFEGTFKPSTQVEEGGLVALNLAAGIIQNSKAIIDISVSSRVIEFGGLVGRNIGKIEAASVVYKSLKAGISTQNSSTIGGLVGRMSGTNAHILDSSVRPYDDSSVFQIAGSNSESVGGLLGLGFGGSNLIGSSFEGQLLGGSTAAACHEGGKAFGGLVGRSEGLQIENSHATGLICAKQELGGLIGRIDGSVNQTTIIELSSFEGELLLGSNRGGGLVGENRSNLEVLNSYAEGKILGEGGLGGLLGHQGNSGSLKIIGSYFRGEIGGVSPGGSRGGLLGSAPSTRTSNIPVWIDESYAEADISGSARIGGLVGTAGRGLRVRNAYSTGFVSGQSKVGGIVGELRCDGPETNVANLDRVFSNVEVLIGNNAWADHGGVIGWSSSWAADQPCAGTQTFWNLDRNSNLANHPDNAQETGSQYGYPRNQSNMIGSFMFLESDIWKINPLQLPHLKEVVEPQAQPLFPATP